ncbi:MAG: transporter substrate-binding domain-containing protein [Granulosicoccus sp.]
MNASIRQQLAPSGSLRVALNMSNFLLVNATRVNGEPDGVSPAMARAIAEDLGVEAKFVCYPGPGLIADAASNDEWDIANIAAEPARARIIKFSPAYCEIQASYLVPPHSRITSFAEVDQPGVRIAVKERAAYDLWLSDNLRHATLQRAPSLDGSFELFRDKKLDALAGLRPKLLEQQKLMPGSVLFDKSFTAVQQSIGCKPDKQEAATYLDSFVTSAIASGFVASLIEDYGVTGKLSVAGTPGA